jgi:Zn-finger domain-containing protein
MFSATNIIYTTVNSSTTLSPFSPTKNHTLERVISALVAYIRDKKISLDKINEDLREMDVNFKVPYDHHLYHKDIWGMPLGRIVRGILKTGVCLCILVVMCVQMLDMYVCAFVCVCNCFNIFLLR